MAWRWNGWFNQSTRLLINERFHIRWDLLWEEEEITKECIKGFNFN